MQLMVKYMLSITALSKQFGQHQILTKLHLEIAEGEVFGLLGPNGAGKTTLIRIIMGLIKPDGGDVLLFGKYRPGSIEARRLIGYMPQQHSVYPGLSVLENVLFFGRMYRMQDADLHQRAVDILQMVELEHRKNDLVANLSGGMIRRVMLATALVHRPRLLILDEPTAGVDPLLRIKFWDWFANMVESGTSIIVTTHNISEAERCRNVVFLRNGQKLEQGTPQELMSSYHADNLEAAFVEATRSRAGNENNGALS